MNTKIIAVQPKGLQMLISMVIDDFTRRQESEATQKRTPIYRNCNGAQIYARFIKDPVLVKNPLLAKYVIKIKADLELMNSTKQRTDEDYFWGLSLKDNLCLIYVFRSDFDGSRHQKIHLFDVKGNKGLWTKEYRGGMRDPILLKDGNVLQMTSTSSSTHDYILYGQNGEQLAKKQFHFSLEGMDYLFDPKAEIEYSAWVYRGTDGERRNDYYGTLILLNDLSKVNFSFEDTDGPSLFKIYPKHNLIVFRRANTTPGLKMATLSLYKILSQKPICNLTVYDMSEIVQVNNGVVVIKS